MKKYLILLLMAILLTPGCEYEKKEAKTSSKIHDNYRESLDELGFD